MYKIITKKEDSKVPAGLILVGNKYGWLWMYCYKGVWFQNHTNEKGDGSKDWFHKKLIYTIKKQMNIMKWKKEEPIDIKESETKI